MSFPAIQGDMTMPTPVSNITMNGILATIRAMEPNGQYGSASGAYQFIDSTWRSLAVAVGGAANYARAKDAPPAVQDMVAAFRANQLMNSYGGHLAAVPIGWYDQASLNDSARVDTAPPGNPLTVRQYAEKWLTLYRAKNFSVGGGIDPTGVSTLPGAGIVGAVVNGVGGAVDAAGNAVTSVGKGVFGAVSSVSDFLNLISDPKFLIRALKVVGGSGLIIVGIVMVVSDSQTVQDAVSTTAKGAAVAA